MKRLVLLFTLFIFAFGYLFSQPKVSEKKEVAIFALGYYGYNIPSEALGSIDIEIQRVFLDLGRFTIIGMDKRFSANDINNFVSVLKKTKEENFVIPEKVQLGEAFLTKPDFDKLMAAFIIAIPVVVYYENFFEESKWITRIKTNITFVDAASGNLVGIANVETSGSSQKTNFESIMSAINSIPDGLQFEIRKINQFQNYTKVLYAEGDNVEIQLGADMGIKVGDEYAIIQTRMISGVQSEKEVGLLVIREVETSLSQAKVLYSDISVAQDTQVREIPRQGMDIAAYGAYYKFFAGSTEHSGLIGIKMDFTRGFYALKPFAGIQVNLNKEFMYPIQVIAGGGYVFHWGRLEFGAKVGIIASSSALVRVLEKTLSQGDKDWITHMGGGAWAYFSILASRDIKVFVEAGADYNFGFFSSIGGFFRSYGGFSIAIGGIYKL